jgi:hypothetical protein
MQFKYFLLREIELKEEFSAIFFISLNTLISPSLFFAIWHYIYIFFFFVSCELKYHMLDRISIINQNNVVIFNMNHEFHPHILSMTVLQLFHIWLNTFPLKTEFNLYEPQGAITKICCMKVDIILQKNLIWLLSVF